LKELISVARGEAAADLLLKNARIVNTFTGEIEQGNVSIQGDRIAGVGDYDKAKETIDLQGQFVAPALINGHTHIESSMLHPARYAEAVVPRGTLAIVTDLHEIASVCGYRGIEFVMDWARKLPLDMFFMAPSCVPASTLETSGARISSREVKRILAHPNVIGLGEVMNFPGVIRGEEEILKKVETADGRVIDGHAPGLGGKELNAYVSARILSDHESTTLEEGKEKLRRGMYLMIREGSSERNLDSLLPLVTDSTFSRCFFVVDDRSCSDLLHEGDIDAVVRKAIDLGVDPVRAIQMTTINPAGYFRLYDRGAIGPGYLANLMTVTDLAKLEIDTVFYRGKPVAKRGKPLFLPPPITPELQDTVRIKSPTAQSLRIPPLGLSNRSEPSTKGGEESHGPEQALPGNVGEQSYPVIQTVPGQIVTRKTMENMKVVDGAVMPDVDRDILKLVVLERHRASGNIGLGLVKGFGLKKGALASSVAHDSHNIIAVGTNDLDILKAIDEIKRLQGGLAVCVDLEILAALPLPIAGLLSPEPPDTATSLYEKVEKAAASLGNLPPSPFAILSFLALPVIPELRLTDLGLVDVNEFKLLK